MFYFNIVIFSKYWKYQETLKDMFFGKSEFKRSILDNRYQYLMYKKQFSS